jgi:uncharacterized protein (DUF169 family)
MSSVQQTLGLASTPIAIGFLSAPPAGLAAWDGPAAPAGCAFWKQAMSGKAFYTQQADHYNCAVGSHTHAITLPAGRAKELEATVGFMVENGYLRMEEVPGIPTLKSSPAVVAYAPVDHAAFTPDAVLVAANPGQAMLLYEAALRAGAGQALTNVLGRPGCAALPLAIQSGTAALSFGCKGNRTFTGIDDSLMYFVVPGQAWTKVANALAETLKSNQAMGAHYAGKAAQFPIL